MILSSIIGFHPTELSETFYTHYQIYSENLPQIDLSAQGDKSHDYISFITPELMSKIQSSVQRFIDGWGRAGIAFLIRGRQDAPEHAQKIRFQWDKSGKCLQLMSEITLSVVVFQRYGTKQAHQFFKSSYSNWTFHSNAPDLLSRAYAQLHEKDCNNSVICSCENRPHLMQGAHIGVGPWVNDILAGRDPIFELAGDVQDQKGNIKPRKLQVEVTQTSRTAPNPESVPLENSPIDSGTSASSPPSSEPQFSLYQCIISWFVGMWNAIIECFFGRAPV